MKKDLKLQRKGYGIRWLKDETTGEIYIVDEYPANQRDRYSAKYAVSSEYGSFIGKARTLKGAKEIIRLQRGKLRDVS